MITFKTFKNEIAEQSDRIQFALGKSAGYSGRTYESTGNPNYLEGYRAGMEERQSKTKNLFKPVVALYR